MNRAANAKDVEHKTTKKTNQEAALTAKKADLEGTQKELDAALAYYDKLKPSAFCACFFSVVERRFRRLSDVVGGCYFLESAALCVECRSA